MLALKGGGLVRVAVCGRRGARPKVQKHLMYICAQAEALVEALPQAALQTIAAVRLGPALSRESGFGNP